MCVFPDLSIIDSWGLAYHTMGTIRGANLESALPLAAGELRLSVRSGNPNAGDTCVFTPVNNAQRDDLP